MVTSEIGIDWVKLLQAGRKLTINVNPSMPSVFYLPNNVTGSTITTFSSWSPPWEMEFKPQIGAPGGYILSAYPVALGGYAVMSGTSMSCPRRPPSLP
ncbi:hypothetical protein E4U61_007931 [Claviceps capensis]|nr:hypothetical protein E4U61_007931 [Claviceps capensis]